MKKSFNFQLISFLLFLILIFNKYYLIHSENIDGKGIYFVKFVSSPKLHALDKILDEHQIFHNEVKKRGIDIMVRYEFHDLVNAISIETAKENVKRLLDISVVDNIQSLVRLFHQPISIYTISRRSIDRS